MTKIFVSNLTGKLEDFKAISTNTLSNKFCSAMHNKSKENVICTKCYSWRMLQTYRKNVAKALQRNSDALSKRILDKKDLPVIRDLDFRFNAHGELINSTHLEHLVNIVNHNPRTTFSLYTKRKDLILDYFESPDFPNWRYPEYKVKPKNLIIVWSNPKINHVRLKVPHSYVIDKVFNTVASEHYLENCTGQKCRDCLICYDKNKTNIIIERVKK